ASGGSGGGPDAGATSRKLTTPASSVTHISVIHQPSGASEGRPIPARRERSPTRTSCSRRNDGPGGGSRSGTAASLRGRQDQAGWRSPSVSGSVSSASSTSSSSALTSSRSPTIDSAAAASSGVTSGACPSTVASAISE